MFPFPALCEPCVQEGRNTLADYVYQPEGISLAGPLMGDPDAWPSDIHGQRLLCREHYTQLPADSRIDYIPAEDHPQQSEEMEWSPQ